VGLRRGVKHLEDHEVENRVDGERDPPVPPLHQHKVVGVRLVEEHEQRQEERRQEQVDLRTGRMMGERECAGTRFSL